MLTIEEDLDEVIIYSVAASASILLPKYAVSVECGNGTTGFPDPTAWYVEAHLTLDAYHKIKRHACFLVEAYGHSMTDAGIEEKDLLIVDTSLDYRENDIVVCELNGAYKAKMIRRDGEALYLVSRNPAFAPIKINEFDDVRVFGVVKGFSRNFRK